MYSNVSYVGFVENSRDIFLTLLNNDIKVIMSMASYRCICYLRLSNFYHYVGIYINYVVWHVRVNKYLPTVSY